MKFSIQASYWPEQKAASDLSSEEQRQKFICINIYFYLKGKKKPNPQPPNPFHHFTSPVLIKTCLGLRACYPHKFCHSVHWVKAYLCMGPSALQALAAQLHKDAGSKLHQLVLAAKIAHCSLCKLAALGCCVHCGFTNLSSFTFSEILCTWLCWKFQFKKLGLQVLKKNVPGTRSTHNFCMHSVTVAKFMHEDL